MKTDGYYWEEFEVHPTNRIKEDTIDLTRYRFRTEEQLGIDNAWMFMHETTTGWVIWVLGQAYRPSGYNHIAEASVDEAKAAAVALWQLDLID